MRERFPNLPVVNFIHDHSPVHKARIVNTWFDTHPEIQRLPFPPRAPDLNPIENIWAEIVRDWEPVFGGEPEIFDQILTKWHELSGGNFVRKCVESMPRRLAAVVDSQGHWTKY